VANETDQTIVNKINSYKLKPLESEFSSLHPLVSWRSALAGLLVTYLCLGILSSLGLAFGGVTFSNVGNVGANESSTASLATAIWFLFAIIVSLFAGSYFAARISKFHTNIVGSAQGLVISSLFFAIFTWQIGTNLMMSDQKFAARVSQGTGWGIFFTLVLGSAAAVGGGALGSRANLRKPLTREQVEAVTSFRTAPVV
jgi:hypothetical protein